jgi:glutamine synthetase
VSDPKKNVFHDGKGEGDLSEIARQYLAGQLALMPDLTALYSPTVNAYKRYVPGVWAPLAPSSPHHGGLRVKTASRFPTHLL